MSGVAAVAYDDHYESGVLLYDEGKYCESIAEFRKYLDVVEDGSREHKLVSYYICEAYTSTGLAHLRANNLSGAEQDLREALAIHPEYADLNYRIAVICYQQKRYDEAEVLLVHALKMNPGFAGALIYLGLARVRNGHEDGLAFIERAAVSIQPVFKAVKYRHAVRAYQDGNAGQFFLMIENLVGVDVDQAKNMIEQGLRLMKQRAHREAARVFVDAVTNHPTYADLRQYLALCYIHLGMHEHAIMHLTKALQINSKFTAARVSLAMAYEKTGKRDRAVAELRQTLAIDPDNAVAARFMSMLQHRA